MSLNCISLSDFSSMSLVNSCPSVIILIGPSPSMAPRIGVSILLLAPSPCCLSRCCFCIVSHHLVTSALNSPIRSVELISTGVWQKWENLSWVPIIKIFELDIVNIFLSISFTCSLGCSKEPSHWDISFEQSQNMFWLRNKKIICDKNCYLVACLLIHRK